MSVTYERPPNLNNEQGSKRSVGIELEFTGLSLPDAAALICSLYGGRPEKISAFEYHVKDTSLGRWVLELDFTLLREKKYEKFLNRLGIKLSDKTNREAVEEKLNRLASSIVPFEIITAPVPIDTLEEFDILVEKMRELRAEGTGSSWIHAFGLHINPEAPYLIDRSILSHLKAFILLEPWIRQDAQIDPTRQITPYIDEFKDGYKQLILSNDYWPELDTIVIDYLDHNSTRNRPLDMLPLFKYLRPKLVSERSENINTTARPAYHYRLPNCRIDEPGWSIAKEWNRWVLVEKLAADPDSILQMSGEYQQLKQKKLVGFERTWIRRMHRWVYHVSS